MLNFPKNMKAVLSDKAIQEMNKDDFLIKGTIRENCLQPNSVDLTLSGSGSRIKPNDRFNLLGEIFPQDVIDIKKAIEYESFSFDDHIIVKPKEFLLLSSNEILNIPNGILAFVCGRSSIARLGIVTESAGLVDSGFVGTITAEIYNQTDYPIKLYKDMRFMQVYFLRSDMSDNIYGKDILSKYNGQVYANGSKIYQDKELCE